MKMRKYPVSLLIAAENEKSTQRATEKGACTDYPAQAFSQRNASFSKTHRPPMTELPRKLRNAPLKYYPAYYNKVTI
jgi:hypothetical protein